MGCGAEVVGSGLSAGGCEAVLGLSDFCVLGDVLSGWPWGGCASWETGVPLMVEEREGGEQGRCEVLLFFSGMERLSPMG